MRQGHAAIIGAVCAAGLWAVAPAHADLKVVTRTTTTSTGLGGTKVKGKTRLPAAPQTFTQTDTTYYKGKKVRREQGRIHDQVTLFDGATGKTITLDTKHKTYRVETSDAVWLRRNTKDFLTKFDAASGGEAKRTGRTRTVFGKTAREYTYNLRASATVKPGVTLGKDEKGKPFPTPPPGTPRRPVLTLQIIGNRWALDSVAGTDSAAYDRNAFPDKVTDADPEFAPFKEALGAIGKVQGLPVAETTTWIVRSPLMSLMGTPPLVLKMTEEPLLVKEAPLPDTLFAIPAGYKEEAASRAGRASK